MTAELDTKLDQSKLSELVLGLVAAAKYSPAEDLKEYGERIRAAYGAEIWSKVYVDTVATLIGEADAMKQGLRYLKRAFGPARLP
jgi:hypothetical protein